MSEKPEALLRRQHADNISVAHMKIRIERLEAENERLREALEKIADSPMSMHHSAAHMAVRLQTRAREALRRVET